MIIIGLKRHHHGNACILEDGKITYSTEEERLNRHKYEGSPFLNLLKIKDLASSSVEQIPSHAFNLIVGWLICGALLFGLQYSKQKVGSPFPPMRQFRLS